MPEGENAAAGTGGAGEAGNPAGDETTVNKDEGAEGAAAAGEGKEGDGDPEPKDSDGTSGDDDKEPAVRARKTAKDFIIERQARKIEKLKKEEGSGKSDEENEGEDESDGDVDPEDEKVIAKVASKILAPIFEERIQAEDKAEVQEFISAHPEFKPYEARVMRDMKHPSRRAVPIEDLFYAAAGPDLIKIGAKKAKEAEDEAARSGTGGGSARSDEGQTPDWANMGKEDFEKQKLNILHPKV